VKIKEDNIEEIREKRKRQLKRQAIIDKIKGYFIRIIVAVFWFGVAVTLVKGCFGTFIKSADEPQDDYEEYIHSKTP
jgi:D-alanyl-lipoteichoic acid acyltransferase DltB (MBOAT superfamily)